MIEAMWIWGAIGLILIAMEIASGTFYLLWLGISAFCVALATWIFPHMPIASQLIIFAALAMSSLAIWKLHYKKTETHHRIGQAQGEEIGRIGTISQPCDAQLAGKIMFTQGLMGSREWQAVSTQTLEIGAQAKVIAVEGNSLRVEAV